MSNTPISLSTDYKALDQADKHRFNIKFHITTSNTPISLNINYDTRSKADAEDPAISTTFTEYYNIKFFITG